MADLGLRSVPLGSREGHRVAACRGTEAFECVTTDGGELTKGRNQVGAGSQLEAWLSSHCHVLGWGSEESDNPS